MLLLTADDWREPLLPDSNPPTPSHGFGTLVLQVGFEPTTPCLQGKCSTN